MDEEGLGGLSPMQRRALDLYVFQRFCVRGLGIHGKSPYAQFMALSDPKLASRLVPPWEARKDEP